MITDELLFEVAVDYYYKKMLQKEIAEKFGVSRVQISKYLKLAHDRGMINIEIIPPEIEQSITEKYLKVLRELFGLKELVLTRGHPNRDLLTDSLAKETYNYLRKRKFNGKLKIGMSWGATLHKIATLDDTLSYPDWTIVPLSGGTTKIEDKRFNMNYLTQSFADRTASKAISLYLPFYDDSGELAEKKYHNSEYERITDYWNSLDIIICSAGYSISRSPLFRQNVFAGKYIHDLQESGVVGDIVSHYYDIHGTVHDLEYMKNTVNLSMAQYKNAGERIVVAGGMHKIESILGLLRGHYVDILISDLKTMENVMAYISEG